MMKTKKPLIQKLGLLGVVSLLSYTAAVVFSPLAYPGYDWMAQAVSDLSAADAPSLEMKIIPAEDFGVVERFSVFAATGFNAALGIHLFCMKE